MSPLLQYFLVATRSFKQPGTQHKKKKCCNKVLLPYLPCFLVNCVVSDRARTQLDHSFKLQHGFGLTSAGFGPFALQSLLSAADQPSMPTSTNEGGKVEDQLLPMGKFWLFQCLSGSVRIGEGQFDAGTKEATKVIAAVLQLILDQDEAEEVMKITGYSTQLPMGSKLYHVMNVCLQSEEVLSNDIIQDAGEAIIDRYLKLFGEHE